MHHWKFAGFVTALLLLCLLMLSSLMVRPLPLRSRATAGGRLTPLAPSLAPGRLLPAPSPLPLPRAARVRPPPRRVAPRRIVTAVPPFGGDLNLLPGGSALRTELAEFAAPPVESTGGPSRLSMNAGTLEAYRASPPRIQGISLMTRPDSLRPLYVSFGALQVLDAYSTWRAINKQGARELNPLLTGVAGSLPRLLAVKAAATATSVYAVERLWKRNPTAAVVTMVGINAAYGFVVARNLKVGASRE